MVLLTGTAVLTAGCTPKQYAEQADRAAHTALAYGQKAALGKTLPFDVTYRPLGPSGEDRQTIRVGEKVIRLDGKGEPPKLTLDECLQIAFRNSRAFQTRVDELYSDALALANARRSWDIPLLGGELTGEAEHTRVAKTSEDKSASGGIGPTLIQRLVHGGALTLAATLDWATDFIPGSAGENVVNSLLKANFTQPLLRGAWRGLAYEDQYRLERDFLFAVFDYERFRQIFATGILEEFYSVLTRRDELENEQANIGRLRRTFALTRVKVEGGQVSRIQQDQAEQDLLNAQIRAELRREQYENILDRFKIQLGLPIRANVELDYPAALRKLEEVGLKSVDIAEADAITVALSVRPDVLTERAKVRDAERDVEIATDNFLPRLDVEFEISAAGKEPRRFERIQFHRHTRFAKVTFNYDLDQTDNRDDYRRAIIAWEKAGRDLEEFLDEVRLEVRESYRELIRSRKSYELQRENVRIAKRRRKLASLEQQEGRATARDVLEAESALLGAQNGLTRSIVGYTSTRVRFLANLGLIDVDGKGLLHERSEPFKFERIAGRYPYVTE